MAKFVVEIEAPAAILLYPILRKTPSSQCPAASSDSPAVFCGCPTFPIVGRIPRILLIHLQRTGLLGCGCCRWLHWGRYWWACTARSRGSNPLPYRPAGAHHLRAEYRNDPSRPPWTYPCTWGRQQGRYDREWFLSLFLFQSFLNEPFVANG